MMATYLYLGNAKDRGEAISHFRMIPIADRRKWRETHIGIEWRDPANGYAHTMAWSVVEEEGGFKRALSANDKGEA